MYIDDVCDTQFSICKHVAKFVIEKACEYVTKNIKTTILRTQQILQPRSIIDAVGYAAPDISVVTSIKERIATVKSAAVDH